ncbi:MAG: tRNA-dihydrouridine synthase family protein [Legionellaceae bacterium]|nr:tRNA-dihydrouridine synthase family protein [Legionellaceae bacterium]
MPNFLNQSFTIGSFQCQNRFIQGPLAGFSCAPFRTRFYRYMPPAYCVSEMISAHDVLYKHQAQSRYLYRDPKEQALCYQLAGHNPHIVAKAAVRLEQMGADLIDLNCGCPKAKIRKKGAGSALLDDPTNLISIINTVRASITIPFTVKIRIFGDDRDLGLAKDIEQAGADALIVHGRGWRDDYDVSCNLQQIARIKQAITIPVIANGDVRCPHSLHQIITTTGCDGYMVSRASTGNPWLFQQLLAKPGEWIPVSEKERVDCFLTHLHDLAHLESEHQAVMQSKSLVRYYFKGMISADHLGEFYTSKTLLEVENLVNLWF